MKIKLSLAMFQPDMAANVGAAMRLCACMGVSLELIEPFGFAWDERRIKQVGMDYVTQAAVTRHAGWEEFGAAMAGRRVVLLSTKAAVDYTAFAFQPGDVLLLGRESAGVPEAVHAACAARVVIPMRGEARSLNVVVAGAIVLGEALRQVG